MRVHVDVHYDPAFKPACYRPHLSSNAQEHLDPVTCSLGTTSE